jgi:DegV family protein with EDD domain
MSPKKNGVAIITDSLCGLPKDMVAQYKIDIVPIKLLFGDKIYRDGVDITPDDAYQLFLKDPSVFKTSPASAGDYLEAYRQAAKQADSVLCITLSSKVSVAYNMARAAKKQAVTELPGIQIEVLDSKMVLTAEGFVVLAAARAAAEGRGMQGAVAAAEEAINKTTFFIVLETIKHVFRTGRIPKVASQVGSILGVKPILTFSSGLVQFTGVVRNKQRGIDRTLKMMRDRVGKQPLHIAVMHAYARNEGEALKERIAAEFDYVELFLTELSPVVGYALGTGTVGFAFYWD